MEWVQWVLTFAGVLVGSGIIQYFVTRKDTRKKEAKQEAENDIRKELKQHLTNVNAQWKVDFCDKNRDAIIRMDAEHKKDFEALKQAIEQLTKNDTTIADSLKDIAKKQDIIAQANVGMIHNTIIRFTDPIIERESVTYEELATLDSLYVPYSHLGGNGECKRRCEDVNKLAKISKEEAINRDRAIAKRKAQELAGA